MCQSVQAMECASDNACRCASPTRSLMSSRGSAIARGAYRRGEHHCAMADVDAGELERLGSALRLAESALEEALEAAENLGNFDHRFDVPRAIAGAQRLGAKANEAAGAARTPTG